MDSSIILRISRFLQDIPPFHFFSPEELHEIGSTSQVSVAKAKALIFEQGAIPGEYFFIVKKGAVSIYEKDEGTLVLVDRCGEADMFGIRPILASSPYLFTAIADEDSILYLVPIKKFKSIYQEYPAAIDFMVSRFAAGGSIREQPLPLQGNHPVVTSEVVFSKSYFRPIVICHKNTTIQEAIEIMCSEDVSSIIIQENSMPVGIMTDKDIRFMVAEGRNLDLPVEEVMSKPVQCIEPYVTYTNVQLKMIATGLHHLCVTEDGTDKSTVVGVITEHDLLYVSANDPVSILKSIKKAKSLESLKDIRTKMDRLLPALFSEEIEKRYFLEVFEKLNDAFMRRIAELAMMDCEDEGIPIDPSTFCYYTMGSAARGEQLMMTDQDHGILFQEGLDQKDFLTLGRKISTMMDEIGYDLCPGNMMASNPEWCQSITSMQNKILQWIHEPGPEEVLQTATFFDFKPLYGNMDAGQSLKSFIRHQLQQRSDYIRQLAKNASLQAPPLSFFRKFVIEKSGEYKDAFDIKLRAISPLTDMVRALALHQGYLDSSNTVDRLRYLKAVDTGNAMLFEEAQEAMIYFVTLKLKNALNNKNDGRYIPVESLSKLEKIKLRAFFQPARKLMDMIERKFSLGFM